MYAAAADSILKQTGAKRGFCLVLGSERAGLSRLVRERCDLLIALPMHGRVDSLNAAASLAAALYAFVLPRRLGGDR